MGIVIAIIIGLILMQFVYLFTLDLRIKVLEGETESVMRAHDELVSKLTRMNDEASNF